MNTEQVWFVLNVMLTGWWIKKAVEYHTEERRGWAVASLAMACVTGFPAISILATWLGGQS